MRSQQPRSLRPVTSQSPSTSSPQIPASSPVIPSFRTRGFRYRRMAGTARNTHAQGLIAAGWQNLWRLSVNTTRLRMFPHLAPQPAGQVNRYNHTLSVPDPDEFQFVLVGDTGTNAPSQYLVASAVSRTDHYPSDFCLILGDVMYPTGGAEGYPLGLVEAFRHYPAPVLAVPGNHDWYDNLGAYRQHFVAGGNPTQPMSTCSWRNPNQPNWYFYMDFGASLRVICLDSGLDGTMKPGRKQQLAWLDDVLASAGDRKILVMLHHPPIGLRPRGHEQKLQALLLPRFKKANVVAVFAGHDHNYQRHELDGCQYIVQGAGGAHLHPLPNKAKCKLWDGRQETLYKESSTWDTHYSFTHCHWKNGRLTGTTVSAHRLPGVVIDRFVV